MRTLRYTAALLLVLLGTVVVASGPSGVVQIARWTANNIEIVVAVVTVTALLLSLAPRGTALAASAVVAVCLFVFGARHGWWSWRAAWTVGALGAIAIGARLLFAAPERAVGPPDPVQRISRLLFPGAKRYRGTEAPSYLSVTSFFSKVTVDLMGALESRNGWMEVAVSCWHGDIRIKVPPSWAVAAGRLDASPTVHLDGKFDAEKEFRFPQRPGEADELRAIAAERIRRLRTVNSAVATEEMSANTVVLHVIGWAGSVRLVGRTHDEAAEAGGSPD